MTFRQCETFTQMQHKCMHYTCEAEFLCWWNNSFTVCLEICAVMNIVQTEIYVRSNNTGTLPSLSFFCVSVPTKHSIVTFTNHKTMQNDNSSKCGLFLPNIKMPLGFSDLAKGLSFTSNPTIQSRWYVAAGWLQVHYFLRK